jgi:hypothetical protein
MHTNPYTGPRVIDFFLTKESDKFIRPYSKSSLTLTLTLNEWRFNPSFSRVSMLFLNSWRVSSHIVRYDTSPPAIQKQQWHSREAQIELPLIECECEWAFRIRAILSGVSHIAKLSDHIWYMLRGKTVAPKSKHKIIQARYFKHFNSNNIIKWS